MKLAVPVYLGCHVHQLGQLQILALLVLEELQQATWGEEPRKSAARPYPQLQPSLLSLSPAPIQNPSPIDGPTPCSQPSRLDPPPLRIPQSASQISPRPGSCRHPDSVHISFLLSCLPRHAPLRLRARPFLITELFHKPRAPADYPLSRQRLRLQTQTPPRLTWPAPNPSTQPLVQILLVVPHPITDFPRVSSPRDTHLNFALNPDPPDFAF